MNKCMDHQAGIVKEINEDKVILSFNRSSACEKCGACGILSKTNEMVMTIPDDNYKVGDHVMICVETRYFFMSAFLLYVLPLIGLLSGIVVCSVLEVEQTLSAVIGIALAAAIFFILRLFKNRFEKLKNTSIRFVKID